MTTMKRCYECGEVKLKSQFHKDRSRKDELTSNCTKCRNGRSSAWQRNNKERVWANHIRRKFNLTPAEYYGRLLMQGYCCGICGKHYSEERQKMSVDHCHDTNHIRGILCDSCNTGLGKLEKHLDKAIEFLKQPYWKERNDYD